MNNFFFFYSLNAQRVKLLLVVRKVNIGIVILCFVLLAAHFFRYGWVFLAITSLIFPFFLLIRKPWTSIVIQIALLLGAIEWARTLIITVQYRMDYDLPWIRMAVILAAIVLINLYAAMVLQSSSLKKMYNR